MAVSDAEYKIVLLGDPGVGKTTWFLQVRQGEFVDTENPAVSMGVDHLEYKCTVQGREVKVRRGNTYGAACTACVLLCVVSGRYYHPLVWSLVAH